MGVLEDIKALTHTPPVVPKKVLIVEDEESLRNLYSDILKNEGYDTQTSENGEDGLNKLASYKPHLVILDLMMPVMSGNSMLSKLREIPEFKNLPVIILTNAGDIDNIRETVRYNDAIDFLIKSNVTPPDILNKVKTHIGSPK